MGRTVILKEWLVISTSWKETGSSMEVRNCILITEIFIDVLVIKFIEKFIMLAGCIVFSLFLFFYGCGCLAENSVPIFR